MYFYFLATKGPKNTKNNLSDFTLVDKVISGPLQKVPLLVIKCKAFLIPLLLCNILAGIETHIFIETHSVQIFAELKRDL